MIVAIHSQTNREEVHACRKPTHGGRARAKSEVRQAASIAIYSEDISP